MKINRPACFINSLLVIGFLQAGVAYAVTVSVDTDTPCGDLESMEVTSGTISITTTNGSCLGAGGGDLPKAAALGPFDVNEGAYQTIDLSEGASVVLPMGVVQVVQPPNLGSVTSPSGSQVTYTAPAPGTITGTTQQTSFTYSIEDATGSTGQAVVSIVVHHSDAQASGGDCSQSSTLTCKGALPWPAATKNDQTILAGKTHAWSFTYDGHLGQIQWVDGISKDGNISTVAGGDALSASACSDTSGEGNVRFAVAGENATYECPLVVGRDYFFNIKVTNGTANGYDLSTY